MTTTAQRFSQTSLHLENKQGGNPEAWKAMVGNKPVSARFALLPNTKPRMSAMGTSLVIQISLAAFVVMLPLIFPYQLIPHAMTMVTEIEDPASYILSTPPPPPPKPPAVARVKANVPPPPPPVEAPTPPPKPLIARLPSARILAPKIERPKVVDAEAPKIAEVFQPVKLDIADTKLPARPRDPVKTGMISTGSSAPATVSAPIEKVQTGGFGDPNGVAGPSNPNKRANVASFGSEALPVGEGHGNGTGGANGVRGTVASTGFGNGVAIPPAGGKARAGTVQTAGFANQNDLVIDSPKKKADNSPAVEPVVILAKPIPVYSAEAIKLNLEGEVLLDVMFSASGNEVQVNRVVKGLGHGLDEAAERAAQQIKYKPAMSNGHAVDFPAVIHIVFQIAY
jgi:TonB family protein